MALRYLLFSSHEGTAQPIRQVLAGLGIEGEYCAAAVEAVQQVTSQTFQLVIVDWDDQPEAAFLLNTARERKAAERPLTLAIVGNDASVPQALQAGANSILRKPIQANQAKDTLTTARDLLRAKLQSAAPMAQAAAAAASAAANAAVASPELDSMVLDKTLRTGEFLQRGTGPGAQFDTETSGIQESLDDAAAAEIDPLEELEPMASAVQAPPVASAPPPRQSDEPRGLAWYMNARSGAGAAAAPSAPPPKENELLGYDQHPAEAPVPTAAPGGESGQHPEEQKAEAALFAYISGETPKPTEPVPGPPRPWMRKAALAGGLAAACAVALLVVPQSVWRQNVRVLVAYVAHAGHSWLNPQPVTPPQAPRSHENFGRAGDEYKLPVVENIPDATTDPSQIRVIPVVDPTAKQPNGTPPNGGQNPSGTDPAAQGPFDQPQPTPAQAGTAQTPPSQGHENPPGQAAPGAVEAATSPTPGGTTQPPATDPPAQQSHVETTVAAADPTPASPAPVQPAVQKSPPPHYVPAVTGAIPSSLKSQMATSTPDPGGNKPVDAAMPSIEPVELPEATVRSFLLEQPEPVYPETAKGQHGTVILAVLIGRDGTVQDAKFLQGSLAFARAAIDGVKQWRFKPYTMNNRPVSTQTQLTLSFKPAS